MRVPDDFADVRHLAVCLIDSAVKIFDGNFPTTVLLGTDLKTFEDDIPADERILE